MAFLEHGVEILRPLYSRPMMNASTTKVRRRLFDDATPLNNIKSVAERILKEESEKFKATYNFDLDSNKPLEGQWKWIAVRDHEVPPFYTESYPVKKRFNVFRRPFSCGTNKRKMTQEDADSEFSEERDEDSLRSNSDLCSSSPLRSQSPSKTLSTQLSSHSQDSVGYNLQTSSCTTTTTDEQSSSQTSKQTAFIAQPQEKQIRQTSIKGEFFFTCFKFIIFFSDISD